MANYIIELPENYNWEGVTFKYSSLWGTGNGGQNLWGWDKGAPLSVSAPERIPDEDDRWIIKVTASTPDPDNEGLAFISRCTLADGEHAVYSSNQLIPDTAS